MDKRKYKEYKTKFDFKAFETKLSNDEFTKEDVQELFSFASRMEERMFSILDGYETIEEDCITNGIYKEDDSQLVKEIKKLQFNNEWSYEQAKLFYDEIKK